MTLWQNKLREANHNPADYRVGIMRPCFITDDPERDWPAVRQAERYRMQLYARFFAESGRGVPPDQHKQRIPQNWVVGDVDHCVAKLSTYIKEHGITDLVTWAVPPGMRPAQMQGSLERFATEVAPRLKAAVTSC